MAVCLYGSDFVESLLQALRLGVCGDSHTVELICDLAIEELGRCGPTLGEGSLVGTDHATTVHREVRRYEQRATTCTRSCWCVGLVSVHVGRPGTRQLQEPVTRQL